MFANFRGAGILGFQGRWEWLFSCFYLKNLAFPRQGDTLDGLRVSFSLRNWILLHALRYAYAAGACLVVTSF